MDTPDRHHIYSVYFAPRGRERLLRLGEQLAHMHLSYRDRLIGIIGNAGSGKSLIVKGMFPGVSLSNDDDTISTEKVLQISNSELDYDFRTATYHIDMRFQMAFTQMYKIVEFVKGQQEAHYDEKYTNIKATSSTFNSSYDDDDEEYEMAREFVIQSQKASASLLQRQFRIGYNKAARIIDQLESDGVIGPQIGSKPREVYIRGYSEEEI